MNKRLRTASAAACLTLAGIALPAAAELPVTLNAGIGYWFFDHELFGLDVDDAATPVIGAEWAFNDRWSAEVLFAHTETDLERGFDADVTNWQVGVRYYGNAFNTGDHPIRPYALLSAGEIDLDGGRFDSVETTVNGGMGIRWMLGDRVGVHLEARALYSTEENETDVLTTAGLNFYLGDVKSAAPAMAAAGIAESDADGDGVVDSSDRCPDTPVGTRVDADGCPLAVAKVASVKLKVNFGFDSTAVQSQYFSDLSELATFLQRFSDLQVDVEGHTDSAGPAEYNQTLSQKRAQAVVNYLVSQHGIAASRLQAKGFGESQPVADNETEAGRAENRRVMATLEVEYEE